MKSQNKQQQEAVSTEAWKGKKERCYHTAEVAGDKGWDHCFELWS